MEENKENLFEWWGYSHINGSIQAKRYFDKRDLSEAHESDFIDRVIPPFMAKDREDALKQIQEKLKPTT